MELLLNNINVKHVYCRDHAISNTELKLAIDELVSFLNKNYKSDSPFVLISAYNHVKTLIAFYAVIKTGRIAIIINPGAKSIELTEIINETDPAAFLLINNETFKFNFDEEILIRNRSQNLIINQNLKDVVLLMYTNAENGKSKAAMITEQNLISTITTWASTDNITQNNNICALVPCFHILGFTYGLILPSYIGCSVFITELNLLRVTELFENIYKLKVDYLYSVPSVYYLISRIPGIKNLLVNIENFITGGIKMSPEIFEIFFNKTSKRLREGYGLTEASPGVTLTINDDNINPESVGKILPGCRVKIISDNGSECPVNQIGEIYVKGDNVFSGYFNDENKTCSTIDDGWLKTGDLGSVDFNGNLYFKGVKKNMFNVAGNNVYPKEVERLLKMNRQVKRIKVSAEQSAMQGDIICASVELIEPSEKKIILFKEWCIKNITNYKIPKIWDIKK